MTVEEIAEVRRALNTPEEHHNYEKYADNAEDILKKYEAVANNTDIISGVSGDLTLQSRDMQCMYDKLLSLFLQSKQNGLVDIDSYDRQELKKLLKLPNSYR